MARGTLSHLQLQRKQVSLLLTTIAILLWSQSILGARLEIGYLGLICGLPLTFFVALALLSTASAILWGSKGNHARLLFFQLLVFISAIWLTPFVTGGSPPFADHVYRNLGMIEYITRLGHFNSSVLFYQNWPGVFIISAIGALAGPVELENWIGVFPLFMELLYFLPLYLFLKNTLGKRQDNYLWAGAWLFYLANWIGQDYLGPPAMALLLLLSLLAIITTSSTWQKNTEALMLLGLIALVFSSLVLTHLLTSLAALCILGAVLLIKRRKILAAILALCLLLVFAWDVVGANDFIVGHFLPTRESPPPAEATAPVTRPPSSDISITEPESYTFNPEVVTEREVTGHFTGSKSHIAVAIARLSFSAVFALIGLIGVILAFVRREKRRTAILVTAIALAPLVLLPLSVNYEGEFAQRLYLYALAPMAYLAVQILEVKKWAVTLAFCLLLVLGAPLHVAAHYGNEAMDYISPGQVSGMHFFSDKTRQGYTTGRTIGKMENAERYQEIAFEQLSLEDDALVLDGQFDQTRPHYAAITRQDREYHRFFWGTPEFIDDIKLKLSQAVNYNCVYTSADLKLYLSENIRTTKN